MLFLEGLYYFWNAYYGQEAKRISVRVKAFDVATGNLTQTIIKHRLSEDSLNIERLLLRIPHIQLLDRFIYQSGKNITLSFFLGVSLVAAISCVIFLLIIGMTTSLAVGLGAVIGLIPFMYIRRTRYKRMISIEENLPDALDLMGRSLKAGHALPGALQMVGSEMRGPISLEFKIVFDEINYGLPIHEAMDNLITRVPSTDLSFFAVAVLLQTENGGNLTEILSNISSLIRARLKLLGTVRVLSAEGRMSAWILSLLPFIVAFLLFLINPSFFNIFLTDPEGQKVIKIAMVLMLVGIFWMSKIVKIRP
ncbi:MAG: type II secretion system F family protein [Opitutaceae bacterium]